MFGRIEKQILTVEGMSCGHCEKRVEQSVGQLTGIKKVQASHKDRTVEIAYKKGEPPDISLVQQTITDLGFEVNVNS